jgi:hypothetical protein
MFILQLVLIQYGEGMRPRTSRTQFVYPVHHGAPGLIVSPQTLGSYPRISFRSASGVVMGLIL